MHKIVKRLSIKKALISTIKDLLIFSGPIVIGQLGQMLIGAGDVFIAARHSTNTLAAIGLANGISSPIFLIGVGLLLGISPILAKKRAESQKTEEYFHSCIIYSLLIACVFMIITLSAIPIVKHLGFEENLVPLIQEYLVLVSFSYFGSYMFHSLKEYLQASERVIFANSVSVIAIFLNISLNYLLVFGIFIFPELGIRGLGYATIIIRTLMGLSLYLYIKRDKIINKPYFLKHFTKHVFKFSLPISISIFVEILAFSVIMILIGKLGAVYAGVHSIALTLISISFMVPLAVSSAVSVKISSCYSHNNNERTKNFIKAAMILSLSFMSVAGVIMYLFPESILRAFSTDPRIIIMGIPIIYLCAISQIFDGAQITLSGVLRGFGITKPTLIITLISYWLIGLPIGLYLGYSLDLKAIGFWLGLVSSLIVISLGLFIYLLVILKKRLQT
jgi:multidrug resistance protein, MATE family